MNLDFMEQIIEKDNAKLEESLSTCQELSRRVLTDVRKIVYSLKENAVESNFVTSINEMVSMFTSINDLHIFFEYGNDPDNLCPDTKIALYRTIQEALTNIVKHAKASEVKIRLDTSESHIGLIIADNGIGTQNIVKGNGLSGIEKRILSIGGSVDFSSDNKGFKINVDINKGC
jgi:signal transduction histidine kinase